MVNEVDGIPTEEVRRIIATGNKYIRCLIQGHEWDDGKPYFWSRWTGWHNRCRVCRREVVMGGEGPFFD